jgi:peptide-methionine (S)-S-oxide reductase
VVDTAVGYTGGKKDHPTYRDVCSHRTGHAEAVEVTYDPEKVSYQDLLDAFWRIHDPTTKNRQGWDVGSQYRSAIFVHDDDQRQAAEWAVKALDESGEYRRKIVTQIAPAETFWRAEEYHQRYYEKHGIAACPI